jgi:hypothetical protein
MVSYYQNFVTLVLYFSQDSSVGIAKATNWTAGVRLPARERDFSVIHNVQDGLWVTYSLLSNGYRGLFFRDEAAGS